MKRIATASIALLTLLTGCSGQAAPATQAAGTKTPATSAAAAPATSVAAAETPSAAAETTAAAPEDATAWAKLIEQSTTKKITTITEDNDPNDLIGRPGGYVSAAVIRDSGADCDDLGSDCGAVVEVFDTSEEAQARSDYIQAILKDNPVFGTEWQAVKGNALLRVSGVLKPSTADKYLDAFDAA